MLSSNYGALGPSSWSGELYEDWVGTAASPEMATVAFGAIEQQDQFLVGTCGQGPPQGVLGFGQAALEQPGTTGFFDQVVAKGLASNVFATLLCPSGGLLWLGGYDATYATAAPVYTPLTLMGPGQFGEGFYMVDLVSISVGTTTVPIATQSFPGTYFDTGANIWSLPPAAFSALTSAIASDPGFASVFGARAASFFSSTGNGVALAQNRAELDAALPSLTFTFGTASPVTMRAGATESYLVTYGGGSWSPAMQPRTPDQATYPGVAAILGATVMQSNVVVFDRVNRRLGFAPHTPCP